MLYLSGEFNGKHYNHTVITPREIAEKYNIPKVGKDESLVLAICPHKIGKGPVDGEPIYPRSFGLKSRITINDGTNAFELIYAKSQGRRDAAGNVTYNPDMVQFENKLMAFNASNYDLFVFLYLHSQCQSSPFAGRDNHYFYYDPEAESKKREAAGKAMAQMNIAIWGSDPAQGGTLDEVIRIKASGIEVKGRTLNVGNRPTAAVRADLAAMFQAFPEDFMRAWHSDTTLVFGLLTDAMQSGIIEYKQNATPGRAGWVWSKGEWAGSVALYVNANQDSTTQLRQWAALPQNFEAVREYLTRHLTTQDSVSLFGDQQPAGFNTASSKDVGPAKTSWDQKIDEAVVKGIIGFDKDSKHVRFMDDDGNFMATNPIGEQTTFKDWVAYTKEFIKTQRTVAYKRELNIRLGYTEKEQ